MFNFKEWRRVYQKTAAYKSSRKRYVRSEKGRAASRKYYQSVKRQAHITMLRLGEMLVEQAGRCDICHAPMRVPFIDHDHECCNRNGSCGKCIRGLLCSKCNVLLGMSRDDVTILRSAIKYLSQF